MTSFEDVWGLYIRDRWRVIQPTSTWDCAGALPTRTRSAGMGMESVHDQ
jgi:hypothetical protein